MLFTRQFLWAALASLASLAIAATTEVQITTASLSSITSTTTSASKTSSTGSTTHTVVVGPKESPMSYVPRNITAAVGDVVVFEFYPTNHSVVKADYLAPCVPSADNLFYSGMFTTFDEVNGNVVGALPTWSLTINDTAPIFYYCTAPTSCLDHGMVGSINANSSETWEKQYNSALTYPYMLVPGQSFPSEGGDNSSSSSSSSSSSGHGLSSGAIAGIVVACVAFVAILMILFFVLGRNRIYSRWAASEDGRTTDRGERTARWTLFGQGDPKNELDGNELDSTGASTHLSSTYGSPVFKSPFTPTSPVYGSPAPQYQNMEMQQTSRNIRGPVELDAHSGLSQLPSESRDYR